MVEDNLVNFVRLTGDYAIEKQMDIINSAPFSLCSYNTEANSYLADTTNNVAQVLQGVDKNFYYECYSGYNLTRSQVTTTEEKQC